MLLVGASAHSQLALEKKMSHRLVALIRETHGHASYESDSSKRGVLESSFDARPLLVGGCWSVPTARFRFDFCATVSLITAASADHVFYILNVAGTGGACMHGC
jgi:hypothetical protein